MFDELPGMGWLLLAYVVGTLFGLYVKQHRAIEATIDSLIEKGYLKHRRDANGEIQILKHNED